MSVMDLAIIRETEGWRIGAITNQLYVGRARSGSDSFTAPEILIERTVLHPTALQPLFSIRCTVTSGHYTSLWSKLWASPLLFCTLVSTYSFFITIQYFHSELTMITQAACAPRWKLNLENNLHLFLWVFHHYSNMLIIVHFITMC